jgi:long-chain acyl-CoA synthetase
MTHGRSRRATLNVVVRHSVASFLEEFLDLDGECLYVQRRGYRTVRWTYRQTAETAFQLARELESRGIAKSNRVLIWGENCAEWVATFFACALRGAIAVPMDDAAAPDFAARVCEQVTARLLLCSRKHANQISGVPTILLDDLSQSIAHHPTATYDSVNLDRADPLEIIFTSGTTAEPKGLVISHGNVLSNIAPLETEIEKYRKYERWVRPIRFLNLLPLSHVFGQFLGIFLPPLIAGTVVFQDSLGPSEVIDSVRRERVSVLVGVPRMLQSLKDKIERDHESDGRLAHFQQQLRASEGKHFFRRWWIFREIHHKFGWKFWALISGGASLDSETESFWGRLGYAVIQGYGLTETTSLVSVNHPFHLGKGSIGKVLPGREVKLADDGEILVRGDAIASGYWQGDQLHPVTGEQGWFRTGDVGALDTDGNLYFKGRKKEVLVTPAGMNIFPEDLEAALRRQPEIRDCVIVGRERGGNAEPCAVLILCEQNVDVESIVRRANASLAEYQRIREWIVWEERDFPRTSTGKPRLNVIRELVHEKQQTTPQSVAGSSPLSELISRISGRPVVSLPPHTNLEDDLHLSSLERVELLSALEDRYQADISEVGFGAARTVGDLEQMLAGKGARRVEYNYPRWTLRWPITWIRTVAYYTLLRPAILLLGWPRIEGREHLRGVKGPVLVVCNHIDDVDVGFVQTALPARLRHRLATATGGEALQVLRTPSSDRGRFGRAYDRLKWTLGVALLNLFPLPREATFLKSFSYAGECVDRGYSVLVFPEGHHTTDGRLLPFRAGVGLLANRLGVPVVPLRIDGLFDVKGAGKKFAPPGKIRLRIGNAVHFEPGTEPHKIAEELQKRVAELGD